MPDAATMARLERVVQEAAAGYAEAERRVAFELAQGVADDNVWRAASRQARVNRIRAILAAKGLDPDAIAQRLTTAAGTAGNRAALDDLARVGLPPALLDAHLNEDAIAAIQDAYASQLRTRLEDVQRFVVRHADDLYAEAGRRSVLAHLAGADASPGRAATSLAASLAAKVGPNGEAVTAFVDSAGKRWGLGAYAQMVVRTTTRAVVTEASRARMLSVGVRLAKVSVHANPCPICAPQEGKLVTLDDAAPPDGVDAVPLASLPNGGPPFHPNCRHSLQPYVPDVEAFLGQARLDEARAKVRASQAKARESANAATADERVRAALRAAQSQRVERVPLA